MVKNIRKKDERTTRTKNLLGLLCDNWDTILAMFLSILFLVVGIVSLHDVISKINWKLVVRPAV